MEQINKTIVLTYDDASRMIDLCKDNEGAISKYFYDWYLGEGEYFSKSGMLIIEGLTGDNEKVAVSFDFNNPDHVEFNVYRYKDQSIICNFFFYRQENMTMENITVDIKYFSVRSFGTKNLWVSEEIKNKIKIMTDDIIKKAIKRSGRTLSHKVLMDLARSATYKEINKYNCHMIVYFTYAMMFYVSQKEPQEITPEFKKELDFDFSVNGNEVKSIYKYTGYIDLRENKTYKPLIDKDPNEPLREYQRHIQKWIVRGHYRKTKNGKIWIETHTKGEGELEKRIYGTRDEKDVNLIPKIFEVTKNEKKLSVELDNSIVLQKEANVFEVTKNDKLETDVLVLQKTRVLEVKNYKLKTNILQEPQQVEPQQVVIKKFSFLQKLKNKLLNFFSFFNKI